MEIAFLWIQPLTILKLVGDKPLIYIDINDFSSVHGERVSKWEYRQALTCTCELKKVRLIIFTKSKKGKIKEIRKWQRKKKDQERVMNNY